MPEEIDRNLFMRLTCAVFCTSAITAFVLAVMRLLKPELYYISELTERDIIINLVVCCMMLITSTIGFVNSCVVMARTTEDNSVRFVTTWLLLDSLFETSRVVYVFVCEVVMPDGAQLQTYDMFLSCSQYFLDSFIYCQMILRH